MNLFEEATRKKQRFQYKGICSVEDLWDLSVEELDSVYQTLRKQQEARSGDSLLNKRTQIDRTLQLQVEIVKHIVSVKLTEKEEKVAKAEKKQRKQKIAEIIAEKRDESLKNMSLEELEKLHKED
jgi:hypothetical protein